MDLIVSCGDLPAYYLDFLVSTLGKPLFYVCGNHDNYGIQKKKSDLNFGKASDFELSDLNYNREFHFGGINVDKKIKNYKDLLVGGLEGSYLYNYGLHQYNDRQQKSRMKKMGFRLWRNKQKFGRALDILLTHAPPYGIHDKRDLPHRGFETYLEFIEKYQPKYLIHGHTHLYDRREVRVSRYMETTIINCYDYYILELDEEENLRGKSV